MTLTTALSSGGNTCSTFRTFGTPIRYELGLVVSITTKQNGCDVTDEASDVRVWLKPILRFVLHQRDSIIVSSPC